jgi:hypothetical protein
MMVDEVDYEVDFGAEGLIGAEKEGQKIVVEGKGFAGRSNVNEFHRAVGQFNDYFVVLEVYEPGRVLFPAVPESAWRSFLQKPVIQRSLQRVGAKLVVYEPEQEIIVSWIK